MREVVDAIRGVDGVVGIVLFGSAARGGQADEGSDLDLLVLFESERKLREGDGRSRAAFPQKYLPSRYAFPLRPLAG